MGRSEGMSFITAIVIVSLLAGSVPGQKKYQRPAIKTPDKFRGGRGNWSNYPDLYRRPRTSIALRRRRDDR